jgi:hypothetical protein
MKPFGYLRDPLFLCSCALYAFNRWLVKPYLHCVFFHSWFNDVLLIPAALPPLLLAHRWLGLRSHDDAPSAWEVVAHLVGWSVLFEIIGPQVMRGTTGDLYDVLAYSVGAGAAVLWWQRERGLQLLESKL